jgi:hypothetical protein
MKRFSLIVCLLVFTAEASTAQRSAPASPAPLAAPDVSTSSQLGPSTSLDFVHAADEVLGKMSTILSLPIKEPLKKSLRSKDEIRAYLIREEKEDSSDEERYDDDRTLEAFGLIPKGFPLDSFMLQLLTDQVAGLYDPKAKEFYIADWIPADEQRTVMAHELTHALEDQYFSIDPWLKAARPNIDAESARQAVSEGSALAAMVDYSLNDKSVTVRDLPDLGLLIGAGAVDEMAKDPNMTKAPSYIRDDLLFPYLSGTTFTQEFLKAHTGWADLKLLFQNPPVSTQQIIHPALYLTGVTPETVTLATWEGLAPSDWKFLEENVMGEFYLNEILKQFLGQQRADLLSPAWKGDRYAVFEDASPKDGKSKNTHLIFRLALDNVDDTARFCGQYSEALEKKYTSRSGLFRRPNYFEFQTDIGGVYLRCLGSEALVVEGAPRDTYDKITAAIGWPSAPERPSKTAPRSIAHLEPPSVP